MSNINWNKYVQKTKNRQPVNYLMEAVKNLNDLKGNALDLGCGSGIDSKYIAENGFNVEAIDFDKNAIKQTKLICKNLSVKIIQEDIKKFNIKNNFYNLIISWNTLPFLTKKESEKILADIQNGLISGGIFVFSIFGIEDEWAKIYKEMSFWTVEELKKTLSEMKFIKFLEEKQKGPTASGETKFWHKIQAIAQKK